MEQIRAAVSRKKENEEQVLVNRKDEVTVDFAEVRAEIRAEAFGEVLKILEVRCAESG